MALTDIDRDKLRRWGIDPDGEREDIIRQLNEKYVELRRARREAEKPVIVDIGSERR